MNVTEGPRLPIPPMKWDAWGDPDLAAPLSADMSTLVRGMLGVTGDQPEPVAAERVYVPFSALTDVDAAALAEIVGAQWVSRHPADCLPRSGGKSTLDLLRRRQPQQQAVDGVVIPGDEDDVLAILQWCSASSVAVVPFGGGTSVVGGLDPQRGEHRAVLSLDLRRMDSLRSLDDVSGVATLGAGMTGPAAEAALAEHGFSLGHFPQSFRFATIGGFAVTRSSGQASAGYGRFDDMVTALTLVTPSGILRVGRAQRSAAGPDLRQLVMGSEGAFGVVTEVSVRVHRIPATTGYEAWRFDSFAAGADAFRRLAQEGVMPTVLRLSDEAETALNLARPSEIGAESADAALPAGGCLAITTFEGSATAVAARMSVAREIFTAAHAQSGGEAPARSWAEGRFNAPYLRDALLDIGVGCETLETAALWSDLDTVKTAVTTALTAALPEPTVVMCHISHTYAAGASLYFTVVYRQDDDPIAQWTAAKRAATQAMVDAGATITHHHAVGVDHRPWMTDEDGPLGVEILRAVKQRLDPAGICNPGKTF